MTEVYCGLTLIGADEHSILIDWEQLWDDSINATIWENEIA